MTDRKITLGDILLALTEAKADGLDVERMLEGAAKGRTRYPLYYTNAKDAQDIKEAAYKHGLVFERGDDYEEMDERTGVDVIWARVALAVPNREGLE